jgi:hypothetical protein
MNLLCAITIFIGFGPILTKEDRAVIKQAPITCKLTYPEFPCPKKIVKREELVYNVICGGLK